MYVWMYIYKYKYICECKSEFISMYESVYVCVCANKNWHINFGEYILLISD